MTLKIIFFIYISIILILLIVKIFYLFKKNKKYTKRKDFFIEEKKFVQLSLKNKTLTINKEKTNIDFSVLEDNIFFVERENIFKTILKEINKKEINFKKLNLLNFNFYENIFLIKKEFLNLKNNVLLKVNDLELDLKNKTFVFNVNVFEINEFNFFQKNLEQIFKHIFDKEEEDFYFSIKEKDKKVNLILLKFENSFLQNDYFRYSFLKTIFFIFLKENLENIFYLNSFDEILIIDSELNSYKKNFYWEWKIKDYIDIFLNFFDLKGINDIHFSIERKDFDLNAKELNYRKEILKIRMKLKYKNLYKEKYKELEEKYNYIIETLEKDSFFEKKIDSSTEQIIFKHFYYKYDYLLEIKKFSDFWVEEIIIKFLNKIKLISQNEKINILLPSEIIEIFIPIYLKIFEKNNKNIEIVFEMQETKNNLNNFGNNLNFSLLFDRNINIKNNYFLQLKPNKIYINEKWLKKENLSIEQRQSIVFLENYLKNNFDSKKIIFK